MNNLSFPLRQVPLRREVVFGVIIITSLITFEIFNYSTTEFALSDLLGDLSFAGVRWATILSIAFCGIDFAGIARLFTPSERRDSETDPLANETWYLFGAWLLAATMNATLTWWGVSLAILDHQSAGAAVINRSTLLRVVPVFVAVLVWLIRVLIIGTFAVAGDRLFNPNAVRPAMPLRPAPRPQPIPTPVARPGSLRPVPLSGASLRSALKAESPLRAEAANGEHNERPEPTYHPMSAVARPLERSSAAPARSNLMHPPTPRR